MKVRDIPIGGAFRLNPTDEGLIFLLPDDECGKSIWVREGEDTLCVNGFEVFKGEAAEELLELDCTPEK